MAHSRLPPEDLYYHVDDVAVKEGRWQQQVADALENCGYAYFLPIDDVASATQGGNGTNDDGKSVSNDPGSIRVDIATPGKKKSIQKVRGASHTATASLVSRDVRPQQVIAARSTAISVPSSLPSSSSRTTAERQAQDEQSRGLLSEIKIAARVARTTFEEGNRVESRWRRPTRLHRPCVDPTGCWHPGRVVAVHSDGGVDVIFEDGDKERLSRISSDYVRLAPKHVNLDEGGGEETAARVEQWAHGVARTAKTETLLCSASRRELAHIAFATNSIRRTWQDPVPMSAELARLRNIWEERKRSRPEWRVSVPMVSFEVTKRLSFGGTAPRPAQDARARGHRRPRRSMQETTGVLRHAIDPFSSTSIHAQRSNKTERPQCVEQQGNTCGGYCSSTPALAQAQSKLVASALAYDRCLAGARDCIARGAAAFRVARMYSEQQTAFEEATATLGPAQPAHAGYTDWRGHPVAGLQSATLEVAEAMDAWAGEWAAARREEDGVNSTERNVGGDEGRLVIEGEHSAPPFLWEGKPLVLTIVGHTENLIGGVPELQKWYGPGFPIRDNPFCLAYPIGDRPTTPRNASVQAYVNGEVGSWMGFEV